MIRAARPDDIPALRRLEVAAGRAFAGVGMDRVAGDEALPADELTPGLREIRAEEAAHGLDEWPRLAMRRDL